MNALDIRKVDLRIERVHHAGGPPFDEPRRRGAIASVVVNPFAGRHQPDLAGFIELLEPLARATADELRDVLAVGGSTVEGYGKGAIVGVNGELELGAAWHVPGGAGLRAALGDPKAMVPASKKIGPMGCQLDIPMNHLHASYLRSHYDVMPVVVPDAPAPDEVVYALVMTTGERPHARIGGFGIDEVEGQDGLR